MHEGWKNDEVVVGYAIGETDGIVVGTDDIMIVGSPDGEKDGALVYGAAGGDSTLS